MASRKGTLFQERATAKSAEEEEEEEEEEEDDETDEAMAGVGIN